MEKPFLLLNRPSEWSLPQPLQSRWAVQPLAAPLNISKSNFFEQVKKGQVVWLGGPLCCRVGPWLSYRSLDCRVGHYVDLMLKTDRGWYGDSILKRAFQVVLLECLHSLKAIKEVLFLGVDEEVIPLIEVLHQLGARRFYIFDDRAEAEDLKNNLSEIVGSLIGSKVDFLSSRAFIRNIRTYKLAFIGSTIFEPEQAEDLSYFHFLTGESFLVERSPARHFPIERAQQLGVSIVGFPAIMQALEKQLIEALS